MLVKLALRDPGHHREIDQREMDVVPRVGEAVVIGEDYHEVHSVIWNLTAMASVTVWLNP